MKRDKVESLIKQIEGPRLDHKSKEYISSPTKEIAKDISSFINAEGGLILIGVRDNKPDGLIFKQEDEERIMHICRDLLTPLQSIKLEKCQVDGKTVVILEMVPSREPVQTNDKYYIRHGSTTRSMSHEEIKKKFTDAQKIYKIIKKKDADRIINQKQSQRDIILDGTQKKKQYLILDSSSGRIIGSSCNIYCKLYESFNEKSKLIFSTLHGVTLEEMTKILAQYYKIFGDFSYSTAAFSIGQSGFNWVGFGPRDFIKTIEDQKERYKSIRKKYGEDAHIHHRESAFFIDEIRDGLFFILCEPNYLTDSNKLTIDYFNVGFVIKEQPFSRLFNDFFHNIDIEPFTIISNDDSSIVTKNLRIRNNIPFKAVGLIQSIRPRTKDDHVWISGAYGKTPNQLLETGLNNNLIVHLRQHHWLEDEVSYHIDRIKYMKFDLGDFPAAIVSIDIDW